MKRALHLLSLTAMLGASVAVGQTVDNFEAYGDDTALRVMWKPSNLPVGANDNTFLEASGGANGTSKFLRIQNGGFAVAAKATDIITPVAGNYTLSFYYKNGVVGSAVRNLVLKVTDGVNNVQTLPLGPTAYPIPVMTEWLSVTTPIFALSGAPVTIEVTGGDGNVVANHYNVGFDEFVLTQITDVPLGVTVFPDDRIYLSRQESITPTLVGGSEDYTQVAYDVENDGDTDFVSMTAPFTFEWDTLNAMPQDTSGTVALKVTVTDSEDETASVIENFYIDNEYNGRESMIINGDFSQFTGTGIGANLPVGWVENQPTPNATYGAGPDRSGGAGNSLQVTFAASDDQTRYTLRTIGKKGNYRDLQTTFWGKGSAARLYYFTSPDDVVYTNVFADAGMANDANWVFVVESPVQNALGLNDDTFVSLATHMLGSGTGTTAVDHFWDDITWEGMLIPETSAVEGWNLY